MTRQRSPSTTPHPPRALLAAVVLVVALLGILRGRELADMMRVIALGLVREERP
jgi:hypothetical protein